MHAKLRKGNEIILLFFWNKKKKEHRFFVLASCEQRLKETQTPFLPKFSSRIISQMNKFYFFYILFFQMAFFYEEDKNTFQISTTQYMY